MAAALLSLSGVFLATYLYLYKIGRIGSLACGTGACETVQLSPYARFVGVEVALIGIGGYLALVGASLGTLQVPAGTRSGAGNALLLLAMVGLGFTLYLTAIELFVLHAICRWCVGSAVIICLIFLSALVDWRRSRWPAPR